MKQQSLLKFEKRKPGRPRKVRKLTDGFGGSLLRGNPRQSRPMDLRKPLHLILKSTKAKGDLNFLNKKCSGRIRGTVFKYAKQFKIKVYRYVNVGNHLHLVILTPSDQAYQRFIRAVTGKIVMGLQTLFRKKLKGFWDHRPFSRVIVWGKDFAGIADYVLQNTLDVIGMKRTQENLSWLKRRLKFEVLSVQERSYDYGQQLLLD